MNRLNVISSNNQDRLKSHNQPNDPTSKVIYGFKSQKNIDRAVLLLVLLSNQNHSIAAGFAVLEQSVRGLGNAYSGGTAGGEDISTIFYNPAGLSEYNGTEIISGAHVALPEAKFKVDSSSDSLNRRLTGGDGTNAGQNVLIPNLYMATDLSDRFRLGLGITVPFGLGTKYEMDWQGRYEAIESQLQTIDINPAISYTINDKVSVGFGFSAQYIDLTLSNAIDFGSICLGQFEASICTGMGLSPQSADGHIELKADGWSWGYNAGLMFKPVPGIRLGIAYRSKIKHNVQGNATFQVTDSAKVLTATGAFKNTGIKAQSDLPANLSLGAIYEPQKNWAVLIDITWTHWDSLDKLTTYYDNPSQPSSTLNLNLQNSIRTSLGLNYHLSPAWIIRSGFSYDESPVKNAQTRTFRIPDSDRYWLTVGLGYQPIHSLKLNLAYAHIFIKDAPIKRQDTFGHNIQGIFKSKIDIISAELQWTF